VKERERGSDPGLGLDFGGVIAAQTLGDEAHPSDMQAEQIAALPDALTRIHDWNLRLNGRLWIVSKASPATGQMTRRWLRHQRFAERTGVPEERLVVVRNRAAKREVCERLGITHFVDDQMKNLELLRGAVPHLYLFGTNKAAAAVVPVRDWQELDRVLRENIPDDVG